MASGVNRVMTGAYTGTGSALSVRTVGFRPKKVELFNVTAPASAVWTKDMADAAMFKRVTAGTGSFVTTGGVTPLSDGFQVGTDADLNTAAELVYWVAHE